MLKVSKKGIVFIPYLEMKPKLQTLNLMEKLERFLPDGVTSQLKKTSIVCCTNSKFCAENNSETNIEKLRICGQQGNVQ